MMPKGIRPTQNKVRKALFDILSDISGLTVLELFAGTGAVGLEALSRGAGHVTLVESKRECVLAIRNNLDALRSHNCDLMAMEADNAIAFLKTNKKNFDLVFLDPPYYRDLGKKILQSLGACDIVAGNGLVVVQHFRKDDLPDIEGGLILCKQARYGGTTLSFYRKEKPVDGKKT